MPSKHKKSSTKLSAPAKIFLLRLVHYPYQNWRYNSRNWGKTGRFRNWSGRNTQEYFGIKNLCRTSPGHDEPKMWVGIFLHVFRTFFVWWRPYFHENVHTSPKKEHGYPLILFFRMPSRLLMLSFKTRLLILRAGKLRWGARASSVSPRKLLKKTRENEETREKKYNAIYFITQ